MNIIKRILRITSGWLRVFIGVAMFMLLVINLNTLYESGPHNIWLHPVVDIVLGVLCGQLWFAISVWLIGTGVARVLDLY